MKKYWILFLLLPAFYGCKGIKTARILKRGEVAGQEFKMQVPFQLRMGLIILEVEIDGGRHEFLLDTGAPNVISSELATTLSITPSVKQKALDSQGGKSNLGFATIPDLAIGGLHFRNTGTAIADLKQSTEIGCMNIDGLIGANLMKHAIWQFDYQQKIVTITNARSGLDIPANAKVIPFRPKITGTPLIDISYQGITDKNVTFDLGSNGNISSSEDVLREIQKKKKIRTNYGVGRNESGLFGQGTGDTVIFGVVPQVNFGDISLQNQVISFGRNKAKTIGTKVFENYRVIIDWKKEEIVMIPVKDYDLSKLNTFGISPRFVENKIYIGFLQHGSDAKSQGIEVDDRILELNGKDLRSCTLEEWCEILDKGFFPSESETSTMLVLKKSGEEKRYMLKKMVVL